ncbi:hypothetical protein HHI36_013302 [Cryptolaemus montrouzieri]|uniref:Uncharacterized protein n=1 Tax=Cryptolaemus montrouzieri TaxID=559131 RepID=A0ABD2NHV9_9CUCU
MIHLVLFIKSILEESNLFESNDDETLTEKKRRRRTFETISLDVIPYPKKSKLKECLELTVHDTENSEPVNLQLYNKIDTIRMINHALQIPNAPMWPNYARWTVKYHANLQNIAATHPALLKERGCFGIQRTNKSFSQQPIDLVLKQTINCDAARRLTGIIQFTYSISAHQRWARSHDLGSTIIRYVYEELNLQKKQDVTADLTNHNIASNIEQLQQFINTFDQFISPFEIGTQKKFQ